MGIPSYWEKTTSRQMYVMSEPAKCFERKMRLCTNRGIEGKVYFTCGKPKMAFHKGGI